jgi:hypothetical protein
MKRLVASFPPRRPQFAPGSDKWDLWSTKLRRGRFSPSTSVFPAKNRSFHQLLHHHNHPMQLAEALRRADHPSKKKKSPADCPRSSNWNETESFMEAAKAQNRAVKPWEKIKLLIIWLWKSTHPRYRQSRSKRCLLFANARWVLFQTEIIKSLM